MKRITTLFLLLAAIALPTSHAFAHGEIETSNPADHATLKKVPPEVSVTFSETPSDASKLVVKDGCGSEMGDPSVEGKALVVSVGDAQPGTWSAKWDVISAEDGHRTKGAISFLVRGQPDCSVGEPSPDETGDAGSPGEDAAGSSEGIPTVVIVGGAVGLGLVVLALVIRRSNP
jgi:methionine-rich copper-binding protein CopC